MINKIKLNLAFFSALIFIAGCAMQDEVAEESGTVYEEFMACQAGPDYTSDNMTNMIAEWQMLIKEVEALTGAWGYVPAVETNSSGDTIWWELQWSSQDAADAAWAQWSSNEDAAKWENKYSSVLDCDGEARGSFDVAYTNSATFGELGDNGYFYSEVYQCSYNEGSAKDSAMDFLPLYEGALDEGYAGTAFQAGNYYQQGNEDGFLWVNFTNSKDSMDKASAAFAATTRDKMFPIFSEFATCEESPDLYHGWTLYWSDTKDFMPTFPSS